MKRITLSILVSALGIGAFSQPEPNYGENKDECVKQVSLYSTYLQEKAYKDAYTFWKNAVSVCPEYKQNLYDNGVYILKQLSSDESISSEQRKIYKDSIRIVYEASIKIFGENPEVLEDYGNDLIVYSGDYEAGVINLKKAITGLQEKTKYSSIMYYSQAFAKLAGKGLRDCEEGVKDYEMLSHIIEVNKSKPGYSQAQETVDKYLGACLTCDKLLPVVEKKHEAAKTNAEERTKIIDMLDKRGCTDNAVYFDLVEIDIKGKPNPTAQDYLRLADIKLKQDKTSEALSALDKAISLAADKKEKVDILEKASQIALGGGSISKASGYANDLLDLNPNSGTAYIVKATAIANSGCGETSFQKSTKYWVAYDYATKAKSIDESVSSQATRLMNSYRSLFPDQSEIFAQGLSMGSSYTHCSGIATSVRAK